MSAFATSTEGRPLVLVPDRGIYELRDGSLRLRLRGTFSGYRPGNGVLFHWGVDAFLALSGGRLIVALSSGELIEILPGRDPVRLDLPATGSNPRERRNRRGPLPSPPTRKLDHARMKHREIQDRRDRI